MSRWIIRFCLVLVLVIGPGPARADAPNAADAYRHAIKVAHLEELDEGDVNEVLSTGYHPKAALDKALDDNQEAFKNLRAGASIDRCRFAPDVGILDKDLGPYEDLRGLALLWFADGVRQAARGQAADGLDAMLGTIKIGLQIQEDRILAARTTGQNLEMGAFLALLKWLQREQPAAAVLKGHIAAAAALQKLRVPFSATIAAERGWTEASANDLASGGTDNRAFQGLSAAQVKAVLAAFHQQADKVYAVLQQGAASNNFMGLPSTEIALARTYAGHHPDPGSASGIATSLVAVLIPSFSHTWQDDQVARVEMAALPVLLGLKGWHAENKKYPQQLTKLVPGYLAAIPADPFGNGPFKYYVATHGCVLYSVGPDHHDDGGLQELDDYRKIERKDIVMRLP